MNSIHGEKDSMSLIVLSSLSLASRERRANAGLSFQRHCWFMSRPKCRLPVKFFERGIYLAPLCWMNFFLGPIPLMWMFVPFPRRFLFTSFGTVVRLKRNTEEESALLDLVIAP